MSENEEHKMVGMLLLTDWHFRNMAVCL